MYNVWGVSRLRDFKLCPCMFIAKYVFKTWYECDSPAAARGTAKHNTLENSINYNLEIADPELKSVKEYVGTLQDWKQQGIMVQPEFKFGLTNSLAMCEFFRGEDLRSRWKLDVLVRIDRKGLSIDWKTGRYKPEHEGDAMMYGAAAALALGIDEMQSQYVYIDDPDATFTKDIPPAKEIREGMSWRNPEANAIEIMLDLNRQFVDADELLEVKFIPAYQKQEWATVCHPGSQCNYCGFLQCKFNNNEARFHAGSRSTK